MIIDKPLDIDISKWDNNSQLKFNDMSSLFEHLYSSNESGAITISINGSWGTGKSSYLKALEQYYKQNGSKTLFFEAWKYAKEPDIFLALLEELLSITPTENIKKPLRSLIKSIGATSLIGANLFLKSTINVSIDDAKKYLELMDKHIREITTSTNKNYKKLQNIIAKLSSKESPFVLLIDDLDRLSPKDAFELLEKLRFYFESDNTIIIIAINDEILNSYSRNNLFKDMTPLSEDFIDKIFNYSYELTYSPLNSLHLRSFTNEVQDKIKIEFNNINNSCTELFLPHRKWINIINRVETLIDFQNLTNLKKPITLAILLELYSEFNYYYRKDQSIIVSAQIPQDLEERLKNSHYSYELFKCLLSNLTTKERVF